MSPSKTAMHFKRCAAWAENKANAAANSSKPWALGNLRLYQNEMCKWLDRRNLVIRQYLAARANRTGLAVSL